MVSRCFQRCSLLLARRCRPFSTSAVCSYIRCEGCLVCRWNICNVLNSVELEACEPSSVPDYQRGEFASVLLHAILAVLGHDQHSHQKMSAATSRGMNYRIIRALLSAVSDLGASYFLASFLSAGVVVVLRHRKCWSKYCLLSLQCRQTIIR